MQEYQTYRLFPTSVFHFKLENYKELNTELENYVLNLKKKFKDGQKKSNFGGWHSPFFDLTNDDKNDPAKKFLFIVKEKVREVINELGWKYNPNKVKIAPMWSIINKKGSINIQHNHPNAFLSASYYVKFPKNSGNIKFFDPKEQKNIRYPKINKYTDISAAITEITPEEGDLLVFPSYLYHSVAENLSEYDRIVISFNVDIEYN